MNNIITAQIQEEQNRGRAKWGNGPEDHAHDDKHSDEDWGEMIERHNLNAESATPMERRQYLVKVAGLAVSAIEALDRKAQP